MNIVDPSGRLVRWRLRLSEFDFDIEYKKGTANAPADTVSRLRTPMGTTVDAHEDDIPCLPLEVDEEFDPLLHSEEPDPAPIDELFATQHEEPVSPVTLEEMVLHQRSDPFCVRMNARLEEGERVPFIVNADGILVRTASEYSQMVLPESLKDRVLHLSHHVKASAHPGGRRLYQTLRRLYYWPSMALDCY